MSFSADLDGGPPEPPVPWQVFLAEQGGEDRDADDEGEDGEQDACRDGGRQARARGGRHPATFGLVVAEVADHPAAVRGPLQGEGQRVGGDASVGDARGGDDAGRRLTGQRQAGEPRVPATLRRRDPHV